MISQKADLLTRINVLMQKTSLAESEEFSAQVQGKQGKDGVINTDDTKFSTVLRQDEIKRLEERIAQLECENDEVIYFVHFLFERFSTLVNRLVEPSSAAVALPLPSSQEPTGQKSTKLDPFLKQRPSLTKREEDVFNLLAKGFCAKEIAKTLFISETTVITHKKNLKEKFNAKNTVELISNVLHEKGSAFGI